MATTFGKGSHFAIADNDISPYLTSVSVERDNDVLDITCFGASGHKYAAALTDGKITIQGLWDKTATVGSQTVLSALVGDSDGATFEWGPEGSASGSVKYTGTLILESYTESAEVAGLVLVNAQARITGAVTTGTFSA